MLKTYIRTIVEDLYRGYKSPKVKHFHKSLTWAEYFNDALSIGFPHKSAKEYADKETAKDELEHLRQKSIYLPKETRNG